VPPQTPGAEGTLYELRVQGPDVDDAADFERPKDHGRELPEQASSGKAGGFRSRGRSKRPDLGPLTSGTASHPKVAFLCPYIEFLTLALRLVARLPRGEGELREQRKRAARSVPLNIAEGSGETGARGSITVARGAAMECGVLVNVCHGAGFLPPAEVQDAKTLLDRLVAVLTRMCRG
jgi:four helix bundle protein